METERSTSQSVPCRACRQPLHRQATKCQHCGELQVTPVSLEQQIKRVVGWIGFFTAFLSLFFLLKEGYFYIEQRQQQRQLFAAHMRVAEQFLQLGNRHYAEISLTQALKLNPNDNELRLRYFLLRAHNLLSDLDSTDPPLERIPELVTDGFSLLQNEFQSLDQARLRLSLARLLPYDPLWQTPAAVNDLFAQARNLAPENAEIAYRYGDWLLSQEPLSTSGLALVNEAVTKEPQNALYLYTQGRYQAKRGDYQAAFDSFQRAIEASPQQVQLVQKRAVSEAGYALRRTLLTAAEQQEITEEEFYGLSLAQRVAITEFTLQQTGSDRQLQLLAGRLFHRVGKYAQAEEQLRKLLGRYDEHSPSDHLELLAAVLAAQHKSTEAAQLRDILARQQELATFEESLETGLEGKHRYKVGLRVAKENGADGIKVLKVYAGYPFAKAGLQAGDRLLEFAHRKVVNLRSITGPTNDFAPGTDVPVKIVRAGQEMTLTVIIE